MPSGRLWVLSQTGRLAAARIGCDPGALLIAQTGVIGRALPMEKVRAGIPQACAVLAAGTGADAAFVAKLTDPAKGKGVETLECPIRVPSSGGEAGEDRFPAPSRGEGPLLSLLVTATALRDEKGRVEGFLFTAHKGKGKPEAVLSP